MAIRRVTAFEEEVRRNPDLILREASDFFMERGNILQALQNLARHLEEASIPYAVIGAIALARHGLARMTMDIDILLSPEGLERFKELYLGRGYVPAFPSAGKTFRAADSGVRIKVITAGEYPGDGKPKPVRFPNPAETSAEMGGIRVLPLERLVELKLASGLTAPHRRRDLADVQDLIRALRLPAAFADQLDASVQPLFRELWQEAQVIDPLQER
jgi:hypothetical protein